MNLGKNILIIGAGDAGLELVEEISKKKIAFNILGLLDDDLSKIGSLVGEYPVIGPIRMMPSLVYKLKIDEVLVAIPSASDNLMKQIVELCNEAKVKARIIPRQLEVIQGKVNFHLLRDIQPEDFLGRPTYAKEFLCIKPELKDKVVLVTGGAGSIGSEIVRQLLFIGCSKIIVFDISEFAIFNLENELAMYPQIYYEIGNIQCKNDIDYVLHKYHPHFVFHSAAYKHVPLMESFYVQAIRNNVKGTINLLDAIIDSPVTHLVIISTDKAVNPNNIIGCTKRITEKLMEYYNNRRQNLHISCVRFGNVIGSSGSVIPQFRSQILNGGPVTVTHKDITRYFITISEAAQLVILCLQLAKSNEIFVLDMGKPIKIYDLALKMINSFKLLPNDDIEIKITGLRPGEKLFEELVYNPQNVDTTRYEKIFITKKEEIFDKEAFFKDVNMLLDIIEKNPQKSDVVEMLKRLVPNYRQGDYN